MGKDSSIEWCSHINCPLCEGRAFHNQGISWTIIGGESGPGARPFNLAWGRGLIEQCHYAQIPVFMKQLGARPFPINEIGAELVDTKGGNPDEWPNDLRVRKFPTPAERRVVS